MINHLGSRHLKLSSAFRGSFNADRVARGTRCCFVSPPASRSRRMNIMTRQHQNGHDKFKNRSLVHFRHMEGTLQQRHAEMSKQWDNLDQEWTNVEKKMSEVGLSMSWASLEDKMSEAAVSMRSPRTPDPVVLNVGGSEVYIPHFVLEGLQQSSGPHTFFGDLFRGGVWDERLPRDSDGQVFLDENPACFQHLVQTLSKRFVKMGRVQTTL